jgi:CubicO group peptidase (beta-lactamase class C family)
VALQSIQERLTQVLEGNLQRLNVAGAVVGVSVGDEQIALARGVANLNTGQPFTTDTGWLIGSVTKILTTTMLLRLVERGAVDLEEPVQRYLPEFTLTDADAAARITVRMLVNHTNGLDADTLGPPAVRGRDATAEYVSRLAGRGVLFEPGTGIHYTNPGFVTAGRIIEKLTGLAFEDAIQQELFDPCGMHDSTARQTQALLRRTAIGSFVDPRTKRLNATRMFTLPETQGGAGSTPISTVADMIAFGRMHLADGVAPNGERVLSTELARAMRTPTFDLGIPQAPPIGLGWWLFPIAGLTVPWHGGGSPGGTSSFGIVPDHDAVIVSFASGNPGSTALHDLLHSAVLEELTGRTVTPVITADPAPPDADVAGEYESFQRLVVVERDGDDLLLTQHYVYDDEHREKVEGYAGRPPEPERRRLRSIAPGQFAPVGADSSAFAGFYGRMGLVTALPPEGTRRRGLHTGFRYAPKVR